MLVVDVIEKRTKRVKTIPLEEYEKNKSKYAGLDYDPGFTWFCWGAVGFIVALGIILFLV
jgi:hypothetical protein